MPFTDVRSQDWEEKVLKSATPVIVDFWAPWCPWCRRLAPDFESLSNEYTGRLIFAKVNVDDSPDISERYGVQGLPTLKLICSGRPITELVGYLPKDALRNQLNQLLNTYKQCLEQSSELRRDNKDV